MSPKRSSLEGKTAVLTASTEGIGFEIAKRLAEHGVHVIVSSRKRENVEKAIEQLRSCGLKADGIVCHAGVAEDRRNLINIALEKTGGIDIVVCSAGVNPYIGDFLETTEEVWNKILYLNLIATFQFSKEVIPYMEKRGGGAILYVSSNGAYAHLKEIGAYCVSKTALLGLTKVMAQTCAPKGIRVNCICPGLIRTRFSEMFWSIPGLTEELPLGRSGRAEECAGIAAFLCSDDASYITGENISIAGGYTSHL